MIWLATLCVVAMIVAGLLVALSPGLMAAVVASSVVSLALSVLFVILRAPDVAMTEAVVGAGLSGVLLAMALRRIGNTAEGEHEDQ